MGKTLYRDIEIRGVVYPNIAAAAGALGVQHSTVVKAMHRGRLQGVGLGQSSRVRMKIRIRGKLYCDAKAAARVFGVTEGAIMTALHRGNVDRLGIPRRGGPRAIMFRIGGLSWPSMRSASLELGFEAGYVSKAFTRNRASAKQSILAAAMRLAAQLEISNQRRAA